MNRPLLPLAAALSLSVLSCSSHDASAPGAADAGFTPFPASPTTFDMSFTVPPSSEDFECTYVTMPSTAGFIIGGQHEYTVGSHHLLLYRTSLTSIPAGEASPTIGGCYEGTADYMSTITGAVYPAATPVGELTMPDGVGLPYSANEIFLFQVHYLNATANPIDAHVSVHLTTQTTPVQQSAGVLFFYDPFIYVPQGGLATASTRCPIPQNITMFTEGSHYHARGVNYQAYIDTSSAPATTPFYTSNNWASPAIDLDTVQIQAGSYIRYYCDYDNTNGTQSFVQGPSAATNEMCMYIGLYYPAMAPSDEQCDNGDTFGTGTTSCTDTLNCLSACPPDDDAGAQGTNLSPCIQQCFTASCPNASAPVITALGCIQTSCSSECATPGTACTSCITTNCATQYEACANATCGTVPAAP